MVSESRCGRASGGWNAALVRIVALYGTAVVRYAGRHCYTMVLSYSPYPGWNVLIRTPCWRQKAIKKSSKRKAANPITKRLSHRCLIARGPSLHVLQSG